MNALIEIIEHKSCWVYLRCTKTDAKQLVLLCQQWFLRQFTRHNNRIITVHLHQMDSWFGYFQSSSKVSDCFPMKKRKQTNCFAYFLMVPLSMASTTFFFGVGAKLSNLRILEIFKCTRPNSPNGFTAHIKLVCHDRYSPACKSSILTMTLQLPKKTRNDSISLIVSEFPPLTRVSNKFLMMVRSRGVHGDEINKIYGRGTIFGS